MPQPSQSDSDAAIAPPPPSASVQQGDNIAHALAGAGGGLVSMTLTYPLITLSTRAQIESKRAQSSTYDAVRRIVQREGVQGLYAGLDSALFGIGVTNFVYYYWYEWTRAFFQRAAIRTRRASKDLTTLESMIAGAIAGSATVLITNPIWVVNTRMTARQSESSPSPSSSGTLPTVSASSAGNGGERKQRTSTVSTVMALMREEGPWSLFAGVLPALVLVINPILQYTIFERLKAMLLKRRPSRRVTATDNFLLGAMGKLLATTITYPYITIKSRMHVAKRRRDADGNMSREESMGDALKRCVREEGWAGLYKGIGPKVTQSVLTAAFLFAFKDMLYEASVQLRKKAPKAVAS